MKRIAVVVIVAVSVFLASGCVGRGIKEGIGAVRGAKGIYSPIQPVSPSKADRPLGAYTQFKLGKIEDTFGRTPPGLFTYLGTALRDQLADAGIPNRPGGKTLLIRGKILYYEEAGAMGNLFGPLEEVVARIELVDAGSGKVLGMADCVGRTSQTVNLGVPKKAEGLAKGIVSWIDARYPEEGRIEQ